MTTPIIRMAQTTPVTCGLAGRKLTVGLHGTRRKAACLDDASSVHLFAGKFDAQFPYNPWLMMRKARLAAKHNNDTAVLQAYDRITGVTYEQLTYGQRNVSLSEFRGQLRAVVQKPQDFGLPVMFMLKSELTGEQHTVNTKKFFRVWLEVLSQPLSTALPEKILDSWMSWREMERFYRNNVEQSSSSSAPQSTPATPQTPKDHLSVRAQASDSISGKLVPERGMASTVLGKKDPLADFENQIILHSEMLIDSKIENIENRLQDALVMLDIPGLTFLRKDNLIKVELCTKANPEGTWSAEIQCPYLAKALRNMEAAMALIRTIVKALEEIA